MPRRCKRCRKKPKEDLSFIEKEMGLKGSSFFDNYQGTEKPVGGGLTSEYEHYEARRESEYQQKKTGKK